MRATDIRLEERDGGGWCLSGLVRFDARERAPVKLEWSLTGGDASWFNVTGDPFLAALLLPAMCLGEDLAVDAPISRRLTRDIRTIGDIYAAWVPGARRVRIAVDSPPSAAQPDSVGLFFSCGVDSF